LRAGIINALGACRDAEAVPLVVALADDTDPQVAEAALRALGYIADRRSVAWLRARAERVGVPLPPLLGESLVRAVEAEALVGNRDAARAIYELLARPG
jgi:HEAT repeat protein